MSDLSSFANTLAEHSPHHPVSRQDASEALHNLTGFVSLLVKINEREQIISHKFRKGPDYDNQ